MSAVVAIPTDLVPRGRETPVLAWTVACAYTAHWPPVLRWLPRVGLWPLFMVALWPRVRSGLVARLRDGRGRAVLAVQDTGSGAVSAAHMLGGIGALTVVYVVVLVSPTLLAVAGRPLLADLAAALGVLCGAGVVTGSVVIARPELRAERRAARRIRARLDGIGVEHFAAVPPGVGLGTDLWQRARPGLLNGGARVLIYPRTDALSAAYQRHGFAPVEGNPMLLSLPALHPACGEAR